MMMLNEKALRRCPFCASDASADGKVTYSNAHVKEQGWEQDTFYFCNCPTCGVSNIGIVGHRTQADAVDAWNTRGPSSPVSELVERLQHRAVSEDIGIQGGIITLVDDDLAEAADSLTVLAAENARLRKRVAELEKADETRVRDISRLTVERDTARDRVVELEKALEPFAKDAWRCGNLSPNNTIAHVTKLRVRDLRIARRVREAQGGE